MGFPAGPRAGMPGVSMHSSTTSRRLGRKCLVELLDDTVAGAHGDRIAGARPGGQCWQMRPPLVEIASSHLSRLEGVIVGARIMKGHDHQLAVLRPHQGQAGPGPPAACRAPRLRMAGLQRGRDPSRAQGRTRENEYWRLCLNHVREYNHSYNFFAGMSDDAIARYQKDALTGHRPTWKMGMNGGRPTTRSHSARFSPGAGPAPTIRSGCFANSAARADGEHLRRRETRVIRNAERKALDTLGLEPEATTADIKVRFKVLVKRHHPDANGGDRSSEERLREIIQAYNYLKSVGFR